MKPEHLQRGALAEALALHYLQRKYPDFRLIARNVRFKCGEIDIIYENTLANGIRELVFVEVKSNTESIERAGWNFTSQKRMKMNRAVQIYLSQYKGSAREMRQELVVYAKDQIEIIPIY